MQNWACVRARRTKKRKGEHKERVGQRDRDRVINRKRVEINGFRFYENLATDVKSETFVSFFRKVRKNTRSQWHCKFWQDYDQPPHAGTHLLQSPPPSTPHVLHRLWASCRHGQHHVESLTRRQGDYLSIWTIFFFSTAQAHSCQRAVSTKQGVVQLQHFTWKAVLSQGVLCQASWLFFIIDITFTNYYAGPVQ